MLGLASEIKYYYNKKKKKIIIITNKQGKRYKYKMIIMEYLGKKSKRSISGVHDF